MLELRRYDLPYDVAIRLSECMNLVIPIQFIE